MKRLTATEKWIDPWYMKLPGEFKNAWNFIVDNCDSAGVWDINEELANFQIGSQVNWADFRKTLDDRIQELPGGKWWIIGFIEFQYGKLTPSSGVHRAVIEKLKRHDLWDRYGIAMGYQSLQEEETAKAKEDPEGGCKGETPSLGEVKAHAQLIGLVEWKAVDFFEKHQSTGWMERGQRILSWKNAMNRAKTYWESEGRPMTPGGKSKGIGSPGAPKFVSEIKTILDAKQKRADELKNRHSSETANGRTWDNNAKLEEFRALKTEIKTLNEQISKMA